MRIIEYDDSYLEDVRDLLVELEEYIVSIDQDHLDHVHPEYREKMALVDLELVQENHGKCFLAIDHEKTVGLIMGDIPPYDEYDYLDYICPKKGRILELVVTGHARSSGVGQAVMDKMENYFKEFGCEYISVEVFAYNSNTIQFYEKKGYHSRTYFNIKKI